MPNFQIPSWLAVMWLALIACGLFFIIWRDSRDFKSWSKETEELKAKAQAAAIMKAANDRARRRNIPKKGGM